MLSNKILGYEEIQRYKTKQTCIMTTNRNERTCVHKLKLLTPVADHTYRRRREDQEAFPKQHKLPQHHYLLPKKLDELRHAASWMGDLQERRLFHESHGAAASVT